MAWLHSLDTGLLRFINLHLQHPVLDEVMKFLSGNPLFFPALVVVAALLLTKGGVRGRVFVLVLAAVLAMGDTFVIAMLKRAIARPRPFLEMPDLHVPVGKGGSGSMPSGHASIWFAATLVAFVYYRRSWRFMLPMACAEVFSRVYLGVHYPSDVLAGAALGAGYAAAGVILLNTVWLRVGRSWFPRWWARFPSLLNPDARFSPDSLATLDSRSPPLDAHWRRLGYLLIAAILLSRLAYLASGAIELSGDEAYQWLWSKHLALSYYSKPPMIAYAQWLGTSLWGDTAFGVRFLSPVIGAAILLLVFQFMARLAGARIAFCLVLILLATPLLAVGSTLLTIDPLVVLFWTIAMILGWRALQPDSTTWHWAGVGLAMGLGFLSKYNALYQIVCFAIFFALWPPARAQLRRPGPYLAVLVTLLCTWPVIVWNATHGWITVTHVSENAQLGRAWKPTLRYFWEFTGAEAGLLNPVFFVAAVWALVAFWKREPAPQGLPEAVSIPKQGNVPARSEARPRRTLEPQVSAASGMAPRRAVMVYLFSMSGPVFFGHWLYTLHSRVQPNWIAPALVPMFCLMVLYWEGRWRAGSRAINGWLTGGLVLGLVTLTILHAPGIVEKVIGRPLPPDYDPVRRAFGWSDTAKVVEAARRQLEAQGEPAFVIGNHYGITGLLSFYMPEARARVRTQPLVYCPSSDKPRNQLYFWTHYRYRDFRKGQNALYVEETSVPVYPMGQWFKSIFTGRPSPEPAPPKRADLPPGLLEEFDSVKDLGVKPVYEHGQIYRWIQLFECRNLR